MLEISTTERKRGTALLALGFRPFFLAAGVYAVSGMLLWTSVWVLGWDLAFNGLPATYWHGHEMVYGYGMAVVAGFLLTAVRNWTGMATPTSWPLAMILLCWLAARLLLAVGEAVPWMWPAIADGLFLCGLMIAFTLPVARARQWKHLPLLVVLVLITLGNLEFYYGAATNQAQLMTQGLHAGLYLLITLILIMAHRVLPFFIRNAVDEDVHPSERPWLTGMLSVLLPGFVLVAVFEAGQIIESALAAVLAGLLAIRLRDWHSVGIWSRPLLWVLYLSFAFIVLGFAIHAIGAIHTAYAGSALHAFALGGIGMMTLGMMARVSLGHTGHNVFEPPRVLLLLFLLLTLAACVRVLLPLLIPAQYSLWVSVAQVLWVLGFIGFVLVYAPMLWRPRVDGKPG